MTAASPDLPPFVLWPGMEAAKLALCLGAIDARLRSVVFHLAPGSLAGELVARFLDLQGRWSGQTAWRTVRLPVWVSAASLGAGLDVGESLRQGAPVRRPGLLDGADLVLADEVLLQEAATLAALRRAAEADRLPAFYATTSETGGTTTAALDWVALHVAPQEPDAIGDRGRVLAGLLDWRGDQTSVPRAERDLVARLERARQRLPEVVVDGDLERSLAAAAIELGVASGRAGVFGWRTLRAHAAWRGAARASADDLVVARALVLRPRAAGATPAAAEPADADPAPGEPSAMPPSATAPSKAHPGSAPAVAPKPPGAPDRVLPPASSTAPRWRPPAVAAQRTGSARGRAVVLSWVRGRPLASVAADGRAGSVAIADTLRRAALFQRARPPRPGLRLRVDRDDLMLHRFAEPTGTLYLFGVDASGSMARNRMREAKGAAIRLLADAYTHRDAVALVAFRGDRASLLLPPTSSVARARASVETLPTGGGTPLAAALVRLAELAQHERRGRQRPVRVVLWTDGRANVPLRAEPDSQAVDAEVAEVSRRFRALRIPVLVVDTRPSWDERADARVLAARLGADYARLR